MKKQIVYVHSGTAKQFMQYQKENPDMMCIRIEDGITLRGREYGNVVRIGTYYSKWNDQEIEESIANFEERFKDHQEIADSQNEADYGLE